MTFLSSPFKNSNQGISLIESLIAMFILGIILVGSITFFSFAETIYFRGLHLQMASLVADSQLESIKNAGCGSTNQTANSPISIGTISGVVDITWPVISTFNPQLSITQNVCAASTSKPSCGSPTPVGVCISWTEPSSTSKSSQVGLLTYVGA